MKYISLYNLQQVGKIILNSLTFYHVNPLTSNGQN